MTSNHDEPDSGEVGWERLAAGGVARPVRPARVPQRSVAERSLGLALLTDLTLISAEFGGVPVVFEPWVTLSLEEDGRAGFYGAYRSAFPLDEEADAPTLCLRRALWRREETGDGARVDAEIVFLQEQRRADVLALGTDLAAQFEGGLVVRSARRSEPAVHALGCSIADQRVTASISYNGFTAESAALEAWAVRWRTALERESGPGVTPDHGSRVSYRASVRELLGG